MAGDIEHLKQWNARREANNSQSVFQTSKCMKFDCVNRDVKCDECIRFSEYEKD
jgi:hypothetical protein